MKHKPEMIAAWAKENGIFGYEMYDPSNRENARKKSSAPLCEDWTNAQMSLYQ